MNELDVVELKKSFADISELLSTYVSELIKQGFSRAEAIAIAIAWQNTMLRQGPSSDK